MESRAWLGILKLNALHVALPPAPLTAAEFPVMTVGRKAFSPQFFAGSAPLLKGGVFQNLIYPRHSPAKESDMAQAMTQQAQEPIEAKDALYRSRIGLQCTHCKKGTYRAEGNGYYDFHRCEQCRYVPMWNADGTEFGIQEKPNGPTI